MKDEIIKKTIKIMEDYGYELTDENLNGEEMEFEGYTNAGENDFIYIDIREGAELPSKQLDDLWEAFDAEEHVMMWLEAKQRGVAGIPDVVTLVEDAKDYEETLQKMAYDLDQADA